MGEIAEMLLDGTLDYLTGEYIGKPCGYPRSLDGSLPWERPNYNQSKEAAYKGVRNYLKKRFGITDIIPVVNQYLPGAGKSLKQKCLVIQKDFGAFVGWTSRELRK